MAGHRVSRSLEHVSQSPQGSPPTLFQLQPALLTSYFTRLSGFHPALHLEHSLHKGRGFCLCYVPPSTQLVLNK